MQKRFEDEKALVSAMRGLPRSMKPRRDLWPGIADRLSVRDATPRRGHRAMRRGAALAAVLMAFIAGILTGREFFETGTVPLAAAEPAPNPTLLATIAATEREYQAAFQAFTPLGTEPTPLQATAMQDMRASWAALQQAEVALQAALEEYPGNPFLGGKLLDLRAQQLEFMRQIHMLDQNSRRPT